MRSTHIVSFLLTILLFSDSSLLQTESQLLPVPLNITNNLETYIVHVQNPKTTNLFKDKSNWYRSFLPSNGLSSGEPRVIYSYQNAINGFAAKLTRDELKAMKNMDGFIHAIPDRELSLHSTHVSDFLGLGQNSCFQRDTNLGKGTVIGVLDTGIFPNHPSFKDEGLGHPPSKWKGHCDFKPGQCNGKIIGAKSFKHGFKDVPIDDIGHGTHTASIAAGGVVNNAAVLGNARGAASGVAPNAQLAIYKVCHSGRCLASDVLAGIDQAITDGVDVISISLGGQAIPFYDDNVAIGTLAAIENGIFVSCSAGNAGPAKGTVENDAPWVMTVGASTLDRVIRSSVRLGNGIEFDGESGYHPTGTFAPVPLPIVYPGLRGGSRAKACSDGSLSRINVKGKIVLCHTGGSNTSIEKGAVVKKAGAIAMILMNNKEEGFTIESGAHVLPASQVSYSDGSSIASYVKSSPNPTATIRFGGTLYGTPKSPSVASFSSRGPSKVNEGVLKPDIVGPGVNILGAWPFPVGPASLELGNVTVPTFNIMSGTSMSAPLLAGVATLLKLSHPDWSPAAIKSAIITSSDKLDRDGKLISDETSNAADYFAMGAGHVSPSKANDPGLVYDLRPGDYISYLCGLGYTDKQVSAVARRSIECSSVDAISAEELNYPSISVSMGPYSDKTITRTVMNVGDAESVYSVQINAPEGVKMSVYPEKLEFSEIKQSVRFNVYFSCGDVSAARKRVSEGELRWVSNKHVVRSPVSVSFVV